MIGSKGAACFLFRDRGGDCRGRDRVGGSVDGR